MISLLIVAFTVLLERKLLGRVQLRTGPYNVRFIGVLQTVVDGIKLLTKGSIGNKVKLCSGLFVVMGVLVNWYMDVIWIIVVLSGLSYIFLAGVFYSECIYSMYGGLRAIMSIISYDILLLLILILLPNVWMGVMILAFSAEVRRTPTDLVEGESELVSGFNTEYAGRVFVGFFLREYLVLTLFFMVWWSSMRLSIMMLSVAIIIRASFPRMKYHELVNLFWRRFFVLCGMMILL